MSEQAWATPGYTNSGSFVGELQHHKPLWQYSGMNSAGEQKAEQVKAGSARLSFGTELPSLEKTFKVITSKRKPEPLSSITKPQPLGPCPLSQSTFWPYAVLFPGAVAGQIFCFLEPRGCCFLCCWPGGGSKQPGKAEK